MKTKIYRTIDNIVEDLLAFHPNIPRSLIMSDVFAHIQLCLVDGVNNIYGAPYKFVGIKCNDKWLPCSLIITPSNTFIQPFYSGALYSAYKEVEPFLNEENSEFLAEHIYFPLVEKPNCDFRTYLKDHVTNNYISHFFGEKGKIVEWRLIDKTHVDFEKFKLQTLDAYYDHASSFNIKLEKSRNEIIYSSFYSNWLVAEKFIAAFDTLKNKYIGGMEILIVNNIVHLGRPALPKSDEYKKYSLMLCALLATIKEYLINDTDIREIDLGINWDDCMNYKSTIPFKKVQIKNFKHIPVDMFNASLVEN